MTTELADQVHDLMECGLRPVSLADIESRAPARVSVLRRAVVSPGLGHGRAVAVAAAVTAVACAVAVAAAQLTGGPGGAADSRFAHARTAAYVIRQVSMALTAPNLVMQATESYRAQGRQQWPVNIDWAYRGRSRIVQFDRGGVIEQGTTVIGGKRRYVVVDHGRHLWYVTPPVGVALNGCSPENALSVQEGDPANWASYIRRTLACGGYTVDGHARLDGMPTIKITGSVTVRSWPDGGLHVSTTLYVNSSTYLPVRVVWENRDRATRTDGKVVAQHGTVREDLRWRPPTSANRARLAITIPAGYRQVHFNPASPSRDGIQFYVDG